MAIAIWPTLRDGQILLEPALPTAEEAAPTSGAAHDQLADAAAQKQAVPVTVEPAQRPEPVLEAKPLGGDTPPSATAPVAKRERLGEITLDGYAEITNAPKGGAEADAATEFRNSPATNSAFSGAVETEERALATPYTQKPDAHALPEPDTETYSTEAPNPVKIVAEEPVSTFSIDTDTASWAVIRSSLTNGQLPPKEAVRIEEMVNYFPYGYTAPEPGEAPFRASVSLFPTPWNTDTQLLRIGLQGAMPALDERPPLNLVFLIDTSGSMDDPKKLPLLKQSFRLMLGQLRPEDRVAIVTYAGSAGMVLEPTGVGRPDDDPRRP